MTRKNITQVELFRALRRLDGTSMVVNDVLKRVQREISEHTSLTEDDQLKLLGLNEQLKIIESVSREVRSMIRVFLAQN